MLTIPLSGKFIFVALYTNKEPYVKSPFAFFVSKTINIVMVVIIAHDFLFSRITYLVNGRLKIYQNNFFLITGPRNSRIVRLKFGDSSFFPIIVVIFCVHYTFLNATKKKH